MITALAMDDGADNFEKMINEVWLNGAEFVIQRKGEEVAVIIPPTKFGKLVNAMEKAEKAHSDDPRFEVIKEALSIRAPYVTEDGRLANSGDFAKDVTAALDRMPNE